MFASREFNDSTANPATITLVLGTASIGMDALGLYLEASKFATVFNIKDALVLDSTSNRRGLETSKCKVFIYDSTSKFKVLSTVSTTGKIKGATVVVDSARALGDAVFNRNTVYQVDPVARPLVALTASEDSDGLTESLGVVEATLGR